MIKWADVKAGDTFDNYQGGRAVLTGERSGNLLVLDLDVKSRTLEDIYEELPDFPDTVSAITPSGGRHHYFLVEDGKGCPQTAGVVGLDVDTRGDGGIIILPPSEGKYGKHYEWLRSPECDCGIATAPQWLLDRARKGKSILADARKFLGRTQEGGRNDAMIRFAGHLHRKTNLSDDMFAFGLHLANRKCCNPPLPSDEIENIIAARENWEENDGLDRDIVLGPDLARIEAEGLAALSEAGRVFERGGELVHAPDLSPSSAPTLLVELSGVARWWSEGDKGLPRRVSPDPRIAASLARRGSFPGVPSLRAAASRPFLRPDLTVRTEAGPDAQTGVYLQKDGPEPPRMGKEEALEVLSDLVQDFPFAKPEDRASWYAWCLTIATRWMHRGNLPMMLMDAPVPGSGKGLLLALAAVAGGEDPPDVDTWPKGSEEQQKLLLSAARDQATFLFFDDLDTTLRASSLLAAITGGRRLSGRVLGSTKMWKGNFDCLTCVAGNNISARPDFVRRGIVCRLVPDEAKPHLRTGFTHPDVLRYALKNRQRVYGAVVSLVREYAAEKVPSKLQPLGSFYEWNSVREIVYWALGVDPCALRDDSIAAAEEDHDAELLGALLVALGDGRTAAKLCADLRDFDPETRARTESLRDLLSGQEITPTKMGCILSKYRDRQDSEGKRLRYKRTGAQRMWVSA